VTRRIASDAPVFGDTPDGANQFPAGVSPAEVQCLFTAYFFADYQNQIPRQEANRSEFGFTRPSQT
jgi:hypothetical protein